MKKILIAIIAFFFFNALNAQVSGYMGNKFSIIYNGGLSFPHITAISGNGGEVLSSFHNALNFEYVYGNSAAVGFRYKLAMNSGNNATNNSSLDYIDFTKLLNYEEKYKFYSHSYGAYVKFYRRNSLAPIGLYTLLGVNFQQLILKDLIRPNFIDQSIITKQNFVQYDVAFNFGLGRNWIIADRMLIGIQFEAGIPVASLINTIGMTPIGEDDQLVDDSNFNGMKSSAILSRFNLTSEIMRLSLNIGFLAF